MARKKNISTILESDRINRVSELIHHYDGYEERKHFNTPEWYGNIFDKLMDLHDIKLINLHKIVFKDTKDGNKT